jgi:outer membrane protein OmpA-like peptidoglycan-associated protein
VIEVLRSLAVVALIGLQGPGGAGSWISYRDIGFSSDSAALHPSERGKVSDIANYLRQNPDEQVAIDGPNERANSVRNALLEAGVPAMKIHTGSFGDHLQREGQVQVLVSRR